MNRIENFVVNCGENMFKNINVLIIGNYDDRIVYLVYTYLIFFRFSFCRVSCVYSLFVFFVFVFVLFFIINCITYYIYCDNYVIIL